MKGDNMRTAVFWFLKGICLIGLASAFTSMYFLADGGLYWNTWHGYGEETLAAVWLCAFALLCVAEGSGWGR